jgi:alkanesulfonate monooxygenase SsuD/methylene tetrahydromethanopterin reductase-like flavin-dependent oxidoreductase (luciferase family)
VHELRAWVCGEPLDEGHPFAAIRAHPTGPDEPGNLDSRELRLRGAARRAFRPALPFAYFFTEGRGVEDALRLYRSKYQPSPRYPEPRATICVWALAADSDAEARRLLQTREFWRVGFEKGLRRPLVPPEFAAAYPYDEAERATIDALRRKALVGTGDAVATLLHELADRLELEELVVVTWTHDPAARHRSYELLAVACGLASG